MASNNLDNTLREGIEAARRGDKLTARRLLQQVLQQDRTNETALMWMASVVDTLPERRSYLEQVLRVNPANTRAREALERLGGTAPTPAPAAKSASSSTPPRPPSTPKPPSRRRNTNPYFLAAAAVAMVMVLIVALFLLSQPGAEPAPTAAPTEVAQQGVEVTVRPTVTRTRIPPTAPVIMVTLDRAQAALPPTFTPTPSPEPTATLTPSPTPLPLSSYPVVFAAVPPGSVIASLFEGLADGSGILEIGDDQGYYDMVLNPDQTQIAFARNIAPDDTPEKNWQLFTAPVSDPTDVRQITDTPNAGLEHPVWSSDGASIVYASDTDGDFDLYRVPSNPDGMAEPEALTANDAYDSYPAFPPDGDTLLFVSDMNTPGFTRMFTRSDTGLIQPFSNVGGTVTSPVYSPDGARIAYVNQQSSDPDIFVIGADGQRPFQLTVNDTADDRAPAWSDDGKWIAFASDRNGNRFLWYFLNVESGAITPLSDLAEAQSIAFLPG